MEEPEIKRKRMVSCQGGGMLQLNRLNMIRWYLVLRLDGGIRTGFVVENLALLVQLCNCFWLIFMFHMLALVEVVFGCGCIIFTFLALQSQYKVQNSTDTIVKHFVVLNASNVLLSWTVKHQKHIHTFTGLRPFATLCTPHTRKTGSMAATVEMVRKSLYKTEEKKNRRPKITTTKAISSSAPVSRSLQWIQLLWNRDRSSINATRRLSQLLSHTALCPFSRRRSARNERRNRIAYCAAFWKLLVATEQQSKRTGI